MDKVRVRYSKTGKAKYISHLDLMETMKRAFIRAGVSLKYSEGFNPHPHLSVALPLSVGVESLCELMDVTLTGGAMPKEINDYLPEGLEVHKTYRPWRKVADIKWVEVECRLHYEHAPPFDIADILNERFSRESQLISKRTKRGNAVIDVAPHIRDASAIRDGDDTVMLKTKISAQNPTISLKDIAHIIENDGIDSEIPIPDAVGMKRIDIYDANMLLFK